MVEVPQAFNDKDCYAGYAHPKQAAMAPLSIHLRHATSCSDSELWVLPAQAASLHNF